ncbi:hybrid sensor histidine kinase/response regulator [Ensifer soli]|uniref:hybrid sensor histidine kinase/response regulator n=1 Tax=Ciceribacter sp. sgz301302 TaxID=3342379 RepID=UPI0035B9FA6C
MTEPTTREWPIRGGELGERVRRFDWSATSLGPIASWPLHLKIKVNSIVNSPIPQVLMWGADHVMIYNDGYREIAGGYHPKALGGRVPEIWPEIWDWNRPILEKGFQGVVQHFRDQPVTLYRNGVAEEVIFDLFYTPIYSEAGVIDGVLCTVLENTARVRIQQELAESRAELARITDALPVLVGFVDRDEIYRFANRGYEEWFGRTPAEIVGRSVGEVIGADYYERRRPLIRRALAGETVVTDGLVRRPDGTERTAEIRYTPRVGETGEIDGIYVVLIDVHDRKAAELSLRTSNARFEAAVEAIHGVLWTNSAEGRMEGPQPAWGALTGQSFEAYQGYGWAEAVHPDDRAASVESWRAAVAAKATYVFEHRVRRHDGAWRTFAIRAVPILDAAGAIVEWVGVHTDITEQRDAEAAMQRHAVDLERQVRHRLRAEEQLRALNETLEARVAEEIAGHRKTELALQQAQKLETIGKLTGGVAHDFNNLLQVVSGNLHLLLKDVAGNARAEARVANALAGVGRGAKLASQLLAFARRQPLEPKVLHLGRLLRGMDDLLRRSIGEAIQVELVVSGGLWNCAVDPVQFENAILNLAINARDAMEGAGKLTIEVGNAYLDDDYARRHDEVTAGQYVALAVSDTGTGIPPELIARVIEPFFTTKSEGRGTGLGLSMVYGFVKQSGGHIKIYSEIGFGTTVRLYLPRAHAAEDREVALSALPVSGGDETVLVVEDDDEVRATTVDLLSDLGYRVLKAPNASAAFSIVESGIGIDLLFTDVVMPGPMTSVEMVRRAKERMPQLAVLYTSGYTENSIVHGGRLDPGVELLSKPYTRDALARKIRHVLQNQRQRRAVHTAAAHPPEAAVERPAAPPSVEARAATVLLVEDDELIRINTAELLADLGFAVHEAGSLAEAQAAFPQARFDVLITDVSLPDGTGVELARALRAAQPQVGVVFATGHSSVDAGGLAGTVLLQKPYNEDDLARAIAAVLKG